MPTVLLPTILRGYACGASKLEIPGCTVAEVLRALVARHQGLRQEIFDSSGSLRRFVNVYKNAEDVRYLQEGMTPLENQDEVSIVPAIAGG